MGAGTKIGMAAAPAANNHSSNKLDSALVHGGNIHDMLAGTAAGSAIKLGMISKQVFADDNGAGGDTGNEQISNKDARSASEKRVRRRRLTVLGFLATCTAATALATAAGTVTLTPATAFALFLLLLGGLFLVNHGVAGGGGDVSLA